MNHTSFSAVVRKWCLKHHGTLSAASVALCLHKNYISRCCRGLRIFPAELMEAMGYESTVPPSVETVVYTRAKPVIEEELEVTEDE